MLAGVSKASSLRRITFWLLCALAALLLALALMK